MTKHNKPFTPEERALWDAYVRDVLSRAAGQWDYVLTSLIPALAPVIAKHGKHTWCPNPHHGKQMNGDAMRIFKDFATTGGLSCNSCGRFGSGVQVLRWWFGWSFGDTIHRIAAQLGGVATNLASAPVVATTHAPNAADLAREDRQKADALLSLWNASAPIDSGWAAIGQRYLASRGIPLSHAASAAVRFHPLVKYHDGDGKFQGLFPALVYLVSTADGQRGTLHRTYLAHDGSGKADVDVPKKLMPRPSHRPLTGGAARLDPAGLVLNIAEGLETALSVRLLTGLPTWCTYSASMLENFVPPAGTRFVAVWGDHDVHSGTGARSAHAAVERLREQGCRAVAIFPHYPLDPGQSKFDWNDALRRYGADEIRRQSFYRSFLASLQARLREEGQSLETVYGARH